jgi:hypothetical protein
VTPGPDATADTLSELAFDENVKAVLKAVLKAALRLGHKYIGTGHLADEFEQFQARRMTG